VFALFVISKKLKHYFQSFPITVLTEHPLRSVVENPEATGRILKWASELKSYRLRHEPKEQSRSWLISSLTLLRPISEMSRIRRSSEGDAGNP